jgi:hypothetical protein
MLTFPTSVARGDDNEVARENLVKGAFIFYLSKYVAWPASRHMAPVTPFIFCVVDNPEFSQNLNIAMQSRTIRGQRILVKSLSSKDSSFDPPPACDILYFERFSSKDSKLLRPLARFPSLTIGTTEEFLQAGGMIHLFERDNKMHFSINIDALTSSGLQLTADMFDLADSVRHLGSVDAKQHNDLQSSREQTN